MISTTFVQYRLNVQDQVTRKIMNRIQSIIIKQIEIQTWLKLESVKYKIYNKTVAPISLPLLNQLNNR